MADIVLQASPVLGGKDVTIGARRLVERDDMALVSIAIPLGGDVAAAAALKAAGFTLPEPGHSVTNQDTMLLRTGPDQLMVLAPHPTPDAAVFVATTLEHSVYVTEQTDAWVILHLTGPDLITPLERICPIDLNPQTFKPGQFARTVMEHMSAIILATEDGYFLLSASSSAGSFAHAIETSLKYTS